MILCVAWRKRLRRVLNLPRATHNHLLRLLSNSLPIYDYVNDLHGIAACLCSDNNLLTASDDGRYILLVVMPGRLIILFLVDYCCVMQILWLVICQLSLVIKLGLCTLQCSTGTRKIVMGGKLQLGGPTLPSPAIPPFSRPALPLFLPLPSLPLSYLSLLSPLEVGPKIQVSK